MGCGCLHSKSCNQFNQLSLGPRGSMVEHVTRNDEIVGSIPTAGFL